MTSSSTPYCHSVHPSPRREYFLTITSSCHVVHSDLLSISGYDHRSQDRLLISSFPEWYCCIFSFRGIHHIYITYLQFIRRYGKVDCPVHLLAFIWSFILCTCLLFLFSFIDHSYILPSCPLSTTSLHTIHVQDFGLWLPPTALGRQYPVGPHSTRTSTSIHMYHTVKSLIIRSLGLWVTLVSGVLLHLSGISPLRAFQKPSLNC